MAATSIRRAVVGLALMASVAVAPSASAKDMKGRFGVGLEQSLGGVSGITMRYWPTQELGALLTLGAQIIVTDLSGDSGLGTAIGGSLGIVYNFSRSLNTNLGFGARVGFGFRSKNAAQIVDPQLSGDQIQVHVEAPVILIEFFMSDSFSISISTGILWNFIPEDGAVLDVDKEDKITESDSLIIDIGAGTVTGSLGVMYYF